jgi:hypothetical protein
MELPPLFELFCLLLCFIPPEWSVEEAAEIETVGLSVSR